MDSKRHTSRRLLGGGVMVVVLAIAALAACQGAAPAGTAEMPAYSPTDGWRSAPLEAGGFRSDMMAEGLLAMRDEGIAIHSLMVVRNGYVLVDAYFYPYDGTLAHDMASVTKSVMTTLIGIAADQGELRLDDPLVSFFPDRSIANLDARKERITVAHLASMSSGLACVEQDERTQGQMMATEDWVQFTLDLPVADEPGTTFVYCNPAIHLLSPILQQATGMTALEYAQANLFGPLGIRDVQWDVDPQGYNRGWGDLHMRPQDAAKLGLLWLQEGRWGDRQIVSEGWVRASSQPVTTEAGGRPEDYGYGWWVSDPEEDIAYVQASGVGGQLIKIFPELDIVIATTGGGFEMNELDPYLIAAIGDLERPLPANVRAEAALSAAVEDVARAPAASPAQSLPEMASLISGRTYRFEQNNRGLEWFRLDFEGQEESTFQLLVAGEEAPRVLQLGLDGVYRRAPEGARPGLGRGVWLDDRSFMIEYDTLPDYEHYFIRLAFEGDKAVFDMEETVWHRGTVIDAYVEGS